MHQLKSAIEDESPDDNGRTNVEGEITHQRPLHHCKVAAEEDSSGDDGGGEDAGAVQCRENQMRLCLADAADRGEDVRCAVAYAKQESETEDSAY